MAAGVFTSTAGAITNPQSINAAKQVALKAKVKLGAGQTLGFKPGSGYYAKSAPSANTGASGVPGAPTSSPPAAGAGAAASGVDPTTGATFAPTMSPGAVAQDASTVANQEIGAQITPVTQAGAATDATDRAQILENAGFSSAASKLLGSIGPQIQAGYNTAAADQGQLAQGFTSTLQGDIGAENAASAAWAAAHGASPAELPTQVDPSAFGNVQYMQNGFIPGTLLAQQGAAAKQQALGNEVVQSDVGLADQQNLQASQQAADLKTAQQVADIAAKYPELFTAQEKVDIENNLKASSINAGINEKGATLSEQQTKDYNEAQHQYNQDTLASKKEGASESEAQAKQTLNINKLNATISYQNGELKIRGTSAEASFIRAQTAANGIDASASKVAGHLIMKSGQPVLTKQGKFVAVNPKVYSGASAATGPKSVYGQMVKAGAQALKDSTSTSGAERVPTGSPAGGTYVLSPQYVSSLQTGTDFAGGKIGNINYPPSTTDPARAVRAQSLTLADMVTQYSNQYGVTPKVARRALIASGWKAKGRPVKPGKIVIPTSPFAPAG